MKTSIVIDISPPIKYLAKFCFSSYGQKCCWPIELPVSLKCNISRKKWIVKFIFSMQRNIEIFYKLLLPFWVCVSRHAQSTQNKKCISLQYLHENHEVEVVSLSADKFESFLQGGCILDVCNQACPKYPK